MIKSENKLLKIIAVYIALVSDIETLTEDGQTAALTFASGKDWEQIYFVDGTALFKEPAINTDAGTIYNQQLNLTLPGDDQEHQEKIISYMNKPVVIRFDYDDDSKKIIGDLNNYTELTPDFSSQNFETKRELEFLRDSSKPALFLT